jgi:hypothetical protein
MPIQPTAAQSTASRLNGARSAGPLTDAGKARSALNAMRHGLCGRSFFLLPDEDPAEYARHEALWLSTWRPRDALEREAASTAIRALWREERADRLEVQVLNDLFGADGIEDEAEAKAVKRAAWRRSRPCCATGAASSASTTAPDASSNCCASGRRVASWLPRPPSPWHLRPRPAARTNPSRAPRAPRCRANPTGR